MEANFMKGLKKFSLVLLSIILMLTLAACGQDASNNGSNGDSGSDNDNGDGKLKIGLSVTDLSLERWQHDRDIFVEKAEELGAEVIVQSADNDEAKQLTQIQNMLSQNVDVLVIIPVNSDSLSPVVDQAKKEGVKVLAYDRLITNSEVDAYVSFDLVRVGELQAQYLVDKVPTGNYFLMGGSPVDNNAKYFREGQLNILQPYIDSGDINVVGDQWVDKWDATEAMEIMENALTANKNNIDAVVASNDSTAGGAIQALAAQGLAGEVVISGQDADLAAVQRIAEGTQTMTVYKPIHILASTAAEIAVKLGNGEEIQADETMNNGMIDVPYIKLDPVMVDKENLVDTVIKDGFHDYDEVYKNVPENERPPRP